MERTSRKRSSGPTWSQQIEEVHRSEASSSTEGPRAIATYVPYGVRIAAIVTVCLVHLSLSRIFCEGRMPVVLTDDCIPFVGRSWAVVGVCICGQATRSLCGSVDGFDLAIPLLALPGLSVYLAYTGFAPTGSIH
jgi:hypothetical protein